MSLSDIQSWDDSTDVWIGPNRTQPFTEREQEIIEGLLLAAYLIPKMDYPTREEIEERCK